MTRERSIFGLRFDSDVELNPTGEELRVFLTTAVRAGTRLTQGSDLERYHGLLEGLLAYQGGQYPPAARHDAREKIFYAVIGRSQFANAGLELAVGQYKYHLNALQTLDLRKPTAFIRNAEAELARLNPRKSDDAEKRVRLSGMLEDRKREVVLLTRRRGALVEELGRIGRYVRDNLVRLEKLCTASVVILSDPRILQQEEGQMVDGTRDRLKEKLKDALHHGLISRHDLDTARNDAEILVKEAASLVRQDFSAAIALLNAVHDHVKAHARAIDRLLAEINGRDYGVAADREGPFARLEGVLISLVSGYRFEVQAADLRSETPHGEVLEETRRDLFKHIVALLEQDRRSRSDRRSIGDRRRRQPHMQYHVQYTERRSGSDRRSGQSRRTEAGALPL